jgi:hypothetical protein
LHRVYAFGEDNGILANADTDLFGMLPIVLPYTPNHRRVNWRQYSRDIGGFLRWFQCAKQFAFRTKE